MKGKPIVNRAIKSNWRGCSFRQKYLKEETNLRTDEHIEALDKALTEYFISTKLTGRLHKDIRAVLLKNKGNIDKYCNFIRTIHNSPMPSVPVSDEYLTETLLIKTNCEILLEETRNGCRRPEEARRNFILDMADLYEKITGKKASHPFNNKGVYCGRFFQFVQQTYGLIEPIQASTLATAIKNTLKNRLKGTQKEPS